MIRDAKHHRFTVVIPTRERCDTLEHSIRTCVAQDYDNLEILVSDNNSQDRTRDVVESFGDSRIRYVNTGKRVCMTDNFEFALSHVKPEGYVIYIGDDDGLLPNAIRDINDVVNQTGTQVLHWDSASFTWPDAERSDSQRLVIPSMRANITIRNSATVIQNVLAFRESFMSLPMIYMRSAVDYRILQEIMAVTGKFFHSRTPDVYSGFAIAGSVERFMRSDRPYGLVGSSPHSTGAGVLRHTVGKSYLAYYNEPNLPFHPRLAFCPGSIPLLAVECYFQARDHISYFPRFTADLKKMCFLMMKDTASRAPETYATAKEAVIQIGKLHDIPEAAEKAIAANPKREPGSGRKLTPRNIANAGLALTRLFVSDLRRNSFYLDCSSLNVNNIYDASLLCDHILRLKDLKAISRRAAVKSSLSHLKTIIAPPKHRHIQQPRQMNRAA